MVNFDPVDWARFARLVMGAAYEATLRPTVENRQRTCNPVVYLTLLGGGVFEKNI